MPTIRKRTELELFDYTGKFIYAQTKFYRMRACKILAKAHVSIFRLGNVSCKMSSVACIGYNLQNCNYKLTDS